MKNFYVTFGQKYRDVKHPCGGHPDGWIRIEAETHDEAREKVFAAMGPCFATTYEKEPSLEMFPRGELSVIR